MSQVAIFWDPKGLQLDALGTNQYLRATDGDTPFVSVAIRMLSIDTPEVHYPGRAKPSKQDASLAQLAQWLQEGKAPFVSRGLAEHLIPKLATGAAGTLQEQQGNSATQKFEELIAEKLIRPTGRKRSVFLRTADQPFDRNGRLLAYMAPSYSSQELETMSRRDRATFNLLMVDSGWAASFPIYPSIPSYPDLIMLQESARDAFEGRRGAWADPLTLTGYEFRMCVRLYELTKKSVEGKKLTASEKGRWVDRYCADMTTRKIFYPQDYHRVPPHNRIFVWPDEVAQAVATMNLMPAD